MELIAGDELQVYGSLSENRCGVNGWCEVVEKTGIGPIPVVNGTTIFKHLRDCHSLEDPQQHTCDHGKSKSICFSTDNIFCIHFYIPELHGLFLNIPKITKAIMSMSLSLTIYGTVCSEQ